MKPLTLDELMAFIPKVMPSSKELSGLKPNTAANVVTFTWHKKHFVAKPNLEVLELTGEKLYITGSSLLMSRILSSHNRKEGTIETVLETMRQAEEFLASNNPSTVKSGLELLGAVKKTLSNMRLTARKPSPSRTLA